MPIFIDDFNQRIMHAKHIGGDIEYDAYTESDANDIEDIPVVGKWVDWTGSGGVSSKVQNWAGTENELQGQIPDIKYGEKLGNLTDRGNRDATHRQRRIRRHEKIGTKNTY